MMPALGSAVLLRAKMAFAKTAWASVLFITLAGVTAAMVCLAADPALPDGHMLVKLLRPGSKYSKAGGGIFVTEFGSFFFGGKSKLEGPRRGIHIFLNEMVVGN